MLLFAGGVRTAGRRLKPQAGYPPQGLWWEGARAMSRHRWGWARHKTTTTTVPEGLGNRGPCSTTTPPAELNTTEPNQS